MIVTAEVVDVSLMFLRSFKVVWSTGSNVFKWFSSLFTSHIRGYFGLGFDWNTPFKNLQTRGSFSNEIPSSIWCNGCWKCWPRSSVGNSIALGVPASWGESFCWLQNLFHRSKYELYFFVVPVRREAIIMSCAACDKVWCTKFSLTRGRPSVIAFCTEGEFLRDDLVVVIRSFMFSGALEAFPTSQVLLGTMVGSASLATHPLPSFFFFHFLLHTPHNAKRRKGIAQFFRPRLGRSVVWSVRNIFVKLFINPGGKNVNGWWKL